MKAKVMRIQLKKPLANGWRTEKDIKTSYGYKDGTFHSLKVKCLASPYANAIIQPNKNNTYVDENLWQKFLKSESDKYIERIYGV